MAECRCPRCRKVNLLKKYDALVLQAHSACMYGDPDQSAICYLKAFDISAELLALWEVDEASIERCVTACLNCFEFCPGYAGDDTGDGDSYLETTGELLSDITQGEHSDQIRSKALASYADVARLANWVMRQKQCRKAEAVVSDFSRLWSQQAADLIGIH